MKNPFQDLIYNLSYVEFWRATCIVPVCYPFLKQCQFQNAMQSLLTVFLGSNIITWANRLRKLSNSMVTAWMVQVAWLLWMQSTTCRRLEHRKGRPIDYVWAKRLLGQGKLLQKLLSSGINGTLFGFRPQVTLHWKLIYMSVRKLV